MIKDKINIKTTTKMVTDIIEEGRKGYSIKQLVEKYELKPPFKIVKIAGYDGIMIVGEVREVTWIKPDTEVFHEDNEPDGSLITNISIVEIDEGEETDMYLTYESCPVYALYD